MPRYRIDDTPSPVPVFGVLGAMIGAAGENLLNGAGSGFDDIVTGALVGAILAMTFIMWLRSE